MTSDAGDDASHALLDEPTRDDTASTATRRMRDWESLALQHVAAHVHSLEAGHSEECMHRGWESQAVERIARYLRTRQG